MEADVDIAPIAALLGDPTRAAIVGALHDGRALPAGELGRHARVSASTASGHLARLVAGGLLSVEQSGRHRYFRLAGDEVAHAFEALAALAPRAPVRSLRDATIGEALSEARTCYDHLAGRLGVALMEALLSESVLEGGDGRFDPARSNRDRLSAPGWDVAYVLSDKGEAQLQSFGIDCSSAGRRP
ncbi:MAG: ArsR/SmtB family transcription factor, partial [Gaiellaceae bacterium]